MKEKVMTHNQILERLKRRVEALWKSIHAAPEARKQEMRVKYRRAYETYQRQRALINGA